MPRRRFAPKGTLQEKGLRGEVVSFEVELIGDSEVVSGIVSKRVGHGRPFG